MTAFCTIYGRKADFSAVAAAFDRVPGAKVSIRGTPSRWQSMEITLNAVSLKLSCAQRKRPGDAFSKMILSTFAYAREARAKDTKLKQQVLDVVSSCQLSIGVVVEPSADASLESHIFRCAGLLDGIAFDGQSFFNSQGEILLRGGRV